MTAFEDASSPDLRSFTIPLLVALYEAWGRPDEAERYRLMAVGEGSEG